MTQQDPMDSALTSDHSTSVSDGGSTARQAVEVVSADSIRSAAINSIAHAESSDHAPSGREGDLTARKAVDGDPTDPSKITAIDLNEPASDQRSPGAVGVEAFHSLSTQVSPSREARDANPFNQCVQLAIRGVGLKSKRILPFWVLIVSSLGIVGILGLITCFTFSGCGFLRVPDTPEQSWNPLMLGNEWSTDMVQAFRQHCLESFPDRLDCDLSVDAEPKFYELQSLKACRNPDLTRSEQSSTRPRLSYLFFLVPGLRSKLEIADRDLSCDEYLDYAQAVLGLRKSLANLISTLDDVLTDRNLHRSTLSAQLSWGTLLLENTVTLIEQAENSKQAETIADLAAEMRELRLPFFVQGDAAMVAYLNEVFGQLDGISLIERLKAYRKMDVNKAIENLPLMIDLKNAMAALERFKRES